MYKLTKVEATDPTSKYVAVGEKRIGNFIEETLKVGEQLYFVHGNRYLRTSIIKEISDHPTDENTKVIQTTYSVYHLTKIS